MKFKKVQLEYGKRRNMLLCKNSKAESHFAKLLDKSGCYYIREKCYFDLKGEWCYIDFYIPKYRIGIEIDGIEHLSSKGKQRDYLKAKFLKDNRNILIYRITNDECFNMEYVNIHSIYVSLIKSDIDYKPRSKSAIDSEREYFFSICQPRCNFDVRSKVYAYCKHNEVLYEFNNLFGLKCATEIKNKYIIEGLNNFENIHYSQIFIYSFNEKDIKQKIDKYNEFLWNNKRIINKS